MPAHLIGARRQRSHDGRRIATAATRLGALASLLASMLLASCESSSPSPEYTDLRIYDHPYRDVDWVNDVRLKAQHHDHVGVDPIQILAYDQAGYDVVSLMDYSGNASFSYALHRRLWPPSQFVAPQTMSRLRNIKFFLPNAEEVGFPELHMTSPFLARYIEAGSRDVPPPSDGSEGQFSTFEEALASQAQPSTVEKVSSSEPQFHTVQDAFALIRRFGGFPCLAHPRRFSFDHLRGVFCTEIYTAYEEASGGLTRGSLLPNWDVALEGNQRIWGIAVNDHYGPGRIQPGARPEGMDSGKIVVLAKSATLASYKEAFQTGAILAIKDLGLVKDRIPYVYEISVGTDYVHIETSGEVTWIAHGAVAKQGSTLFFSELGPGWRYVRAEIKGTDGSVVYTQAFSVRPRGDVDGDYNVDSVDRALCNQVASGTSLSRVHVEAC